MGEITREAEKYKVLEDVGWLVESLYCLGYYAGKGVCGY